MRRWIAILVFVLSSVLNYLDRQVLATMVDIWRLRPEFPFSYSDYGLLLSVFSVAYAASAPFMGLFLDRVGLNRGITFAVALWGVASAGTGLVHGMSGLIFWRILLGVAEAAGVSAIGKAIAMYLLPEERAVGQASSQLGLSLGASLAPRFAVFFAYRYSWRWTFFAVAILSVAWIPLWMATSRAIPAVVDSHGASSGARSEQLLRDRRLWALVIANAVSMTLYSLWTNWTPTYLVHLGLTPPQAANYSWVVPIFGYVGAFLGGSLSWRLIRRGASPVDARKRVCLWAAFASLATAALPLTRDPLLATVGMSFSFFAIGAWSTNLYTLPIDLFGAARSGFGIAALVFAYGAMQAAISGPLAKVIDVYGFPPVCITFAVLPLIAYAIVHWMIPQPLQFSPPEAATVD